ncbi:DUF3093 domain-containing protein [Nocardioides acrostichi]|uniref:DUF3093 domain-containing protein n=1 Tax=Nocardioides acrostichi TaxID=2784339 RepID=UPI002E2B65D9|nr:DUF3093 domain-containing protein [Nocardioides acrostichi]
MPSSTPAYHERLWVPLRWWVQGTMLVASLWLAMVVAVPGPLAWVLTAAALGLMALLFLSYGSAAVTLSDGVLHAGRAQIEVRHLGEATALDEDAARRAAGVEADARAFLLLRPYRKRALMVEIADPADPAPYWLISSRRPQAIVEALRANT